MRCDQCCTQAEAVPAPCEFTIICIAGYALPLRAGGQFDLEAGPDLIGQCLQKIGARVKRKNRQQHDDCGSVDKKLSASLRDHAHGHAVCGEAGLAPRRMAASLTGILISPAKMPSAMAMYHTTS